ECERREQGGKAEQADFFHGRVSIRGVDEAAYRRASSPEHCHLTRFALPHGWPAHLRAAGLGSRLQPAKAGTPTLATLPAGWRERSLRRGAGLGELLLQLGRDLARALAAGELAAAQKPALAALAQFHRRATLGTGFVDLDHRGRLLRRRGRQVQLAL